MVLADNVDGGDDLDLIVSTMNGNVFCFSTPSPHHPLKARSIPTFFIFFMFLFFNVRVTNILKSIRRGDQLIKGGTIRQSVTVVKVSLSLIQPEASATRKAKTSGLRSRLLITTDTHLVHKHPTTLL